MIHSTRLLWHKSRTCFIDAEKRPCFDELDRAKRMERFERASGMKVEMQERVDRSRTVDTRLNDASLSLEERQRIIESNTARDSLMHPDKALRHLSTQEQTRLKYVVEKARDIEEETNVSFGLRNGVLVITDVQIPQVVAPATPRAKLSLVDGDAPRIAPVAEQVDVTDRLTQLQNALATVRNKMQAPTGQRVYDIGSRRPVSQRAFKRGEQTTAGQEFEKDTQLAHVKEAILTEINLTVAFENTDPKLLAGLPMSERRRHKDRFIPAVMSAVQKDITLIKNLLTNPEAKDEAREKKGWPGTPAELMKVIGVAAAKNPQALNYIPSKFKTGEYKEKYHQWVIDNVADKHKDVLYFVDQQNMTEDQQTAFFTKAIAVNPWAFTHLPTEWKENPDNHEKLHEFFDTHFSDQEQALRQLYYNRQHFKEYPTHKMTLVDQGQKTAIAQVLGSNHKALHYLLQRPSMSHIADWVRTTNPERYDATVLKLAERNPRYISMIRDESALDDLLDKDDVDIIRHLPYTFLRARQDKVRERVKAGTLDAKALDYLPYRYTTDPNERVADLLSQPESFGQLLSTHRRNPLYIYIAKKAGETYVNPDGRPEKLEFDWGDIPVNRTHYEYKSSDDIVTMITSKHMVDFTNDVLRHFQKNDESPNAAVLNQITSIYNHEDVKPEVKKVIESFNSILTKLQEKKAAEDAKKAAEEANKAPPPPPDIV